MASTTEPILLRLLTIGPESERATWEGDEPIHRSVYIALDAGHIAVWDADNGVSDLYPLGGVNYVYNATAASSGTTTTISDLIGATVKAVDRGGIGIKLVTGTPNDGEVSFDASTGTFTLGSNDAWGSEWLRIWYTGIEEVAAP